MFLPGNFNIFFNSWLDIKGENNLEKKIYRKLVGRKENLKFPIFGELEILNFKILDLEKTIPTNL